MIQFRRLILTGIHIVYSFCVLAQVQSVGVDDFERYLIETKAEQLIDIRTSQEFLKYRIQSARNIDFRSIDFKEKIEALDKTKPVLIYCLSGNRSKAALVLFQEAGFKTVYELSGGINAWSKAGKPIDQDLSGKGEVSSDEYDTIVSSKGYVLVDFYAPWCAPCRKMLPMLKELVDNYPGKFRLLTIDFDQNRLLTNQKNIKSVPYLIVFKDGKKIWERNGEATIEELIKILKLE